MAKINIRSPYFVNVTDTNLTSILLDLYVYTGTQTTDRGSVTYEINSTAYNDKVSVDISELVRDYLDITFNGTYTSQMVWVDYQVTKFISSVAQTPDAIVALEGFDGYGYFEDGANPQNDNELLQSNTIDYVLEGQPYIVPVNANETVDVKFYLEGGLESTVLAPDTVESDEVILYASDTYIDEVIINDGVSTTTIKVKQIDECKHTPYKITFVNKFGALQDIWFFKRSNLSLSVEDEKYKSNILSSGTYSINEHRNKILNKQGKESLTLNSGFVDEQYNEVFRQLMLSEKVWINYNSQTLPINISSSSLNYKTSLNDNLINYTINTEFAFDKINNVR